MCGGSMEVLPCSRVAHIARTKKPYHNNIAFYTRRNALRVAEVWMDEYKSNVYQAWNINMEVSRCSAAGWLQLVCTLHCTCLNSFHFALYYCWTVIVISFYKDVYFNVVMALFRPLSLKVSCPNFVE